MRLKVLLWRIISTSRVTLRCYWMEEMRYLCPKTSNKWSINSMSSKGNKPILLLKSMYQKANSWLLKTYNNLFLNILNIHWFMSQTKMAIFILNGKNVNKTLRRCSLTMKQKILPNNLMLNKHHPSYISLSLLLKKLSRELSFRQKTLLETFTIKYQP